MLLHHLLPLQSMRWPQNGNHPLNHGVNQRNVPVEKYLICLRTTSGLIATVVETCDANDAFRYAVPYQVIIVNEMYRYATNVIKRWKKDRRQKIYQNLKNIQQYNSSNIRLPCVPISIITSMLFEFKPKNSNWQERLLLLRLLLKLRLKYKA